MAASVLATICAERLTKLLVRYSRAQPPVVRNHSQCAARVLARTPSDSTAAYLKPLTAATRGPPLAAPVAEPRFVAKWRQLGGIPGIGRQFQPNGRSELRAPADEPRRLRASFLKSSTTSGLEEWRNFRAGQFVSLFKSQSSQSVPRKSFRQDPSAFDRPKLYRDCY